MDNPWLSPSINKHFSGRAGLEAQLIMGEEISPLFPPAPLQQLPVQGCSSHQTPPHIIYLWEECFQQLHSSQPRRRVSGERETCVTKLAGLLLTPEEWSSWNGPINAKPAQGAEISVWKGATSGTFSNS